MQYEQYQPGPQQPPLPGRSSSSYDERWHKYSGEGSLGDWSRSMTPRSSSISPQPQMRAVTPSSAFRPPQVPVRRRQRHCAQRRYLQRQLHPAPACAPLHVPPQADALYNQQPRQKKQRLADNNLAAGYGSYDHVHGYGYGYR